MENIKPIIAKNIAELRQTAKMTQIELAERLNYSDKAVSKWERGESVPDIAVLAQIAEMFGVTLDYLIREEHDEPQQISAENKITEADAAQKGSIRKRRRTMITGMSILLVWLVATLVFVITALIAKSGKWLWLTFVYAVPVSMIVWLVFNAIWFNRRRNYLIISLLMWSVLAAVVVSFLAFGINVWLVFALGIPGQIIILMWFMMGYSRKNTLTENKD